MSVAKRVKSAIDKMEAKDPEGALYEICSAIDATAQGEYGGSGKLQYKQWVQDNFYLITRSGLGVPIGNLNVGYSHPRINANPSGSVPFEEILYHAVRCGLYHETAISAGIAFEFGHRIQGQHSGGPAVLPAELIMGLIVAVIVSPANASLHISEPCMLAYSGVPLNVNALWGRRNEFLWFLEATAVQPTSPQVQP